VAKGIRKTKSRFGGRLEPLSHVAMQLHQGSGELQTVTGVDLVRAHSAVREDQYRLSVGLIAAEAMLRLFTEQEKNERAFTALTRFLDVLDEAGAQASRPALDPLALSFQLKLLWLSGYLPHLTSCAECGAEDVPLVAYSPQAAAPSVAPTRAMHFRSTLQAAQASRRSYRAVRRRIRRHAVRESLRDALRVVTASYEYHGGFRLRTLSA
jgi:DNA repair protein RecO (recombination protein O)